MIYSKGHGIIDHTVNIASLTGTLSGCFSLILVASAARTSVESDRERERESLSTTYIIPLCESLVRASA